MLQSCRLMRLTTTLVDFHVTEHGQVSNIRHSCAPLLACRPGSQPTPQDVSTVTDAMMRGQEAQGAARADGPCTLPQASEIAVSAGFIRTTTAGGSQGPKSELTRIGQARPKWYSACVEQYIKHKQTRRRACKRAKRPVDRARIATVNEIRFAALPDLFQMQGLKLSCELVGSSDTSSRPITYDLVRQSPAPRSCTDEQVMLRPSHPLDHPSMSLLGATRSELSIRVRCLPIISRERTRSTRSHSEIPNFSFVAEVCARWLEA